MFTYTIDKERRRYLEPLDGRLLQATTTDAPAAEVVQLYKSLADIERSLRVLKSRIEIGTPITGCPGAFALSRRSASWP